MLDHHLEAFLAGDLDAVMEDYAQDAVFIARGRCLTGREQVRESFAALLTGPFTPGTYAFTLEDEQVVGEIAFIVWHASCAAVEIPIASDTLVVREGKIVVQTLAAKLEPK